MRVEPISTCVADAIKVPIGILKSLMTDNPEVIHALRIGNEKRPGVLRCETFGLLTSGRRIGTNSHLGAK